MFALLKFRHVIGFFFKLFNICLQTSTYVQNDVVKFHWTCTTKNSSPSTELFQRTISTHSPEEADRYCFEMSITFLGVQR